MVRPTTFASTRNADEMSEPDSFTDVLAGLEAAEEQAANEIFNRFAHRLLALAPSPPAIQWLPSRTNDF